MLQCLTVVGYLSYEHCILISLFGYDIDYIAIRHEHFIFEITSTFAAVDNTNEVMAMLCSTSIYSYNKLKRLFLMFIARFNFTFMYLLIFNCLSCI